MWYFNLSKDIFLDKMFQNAHCCHNQSHNKNASQVMNSNIPKLVYETRFTSPIVVSEEANLGLVSSDCWCKKWSFKENDGQNFEDYLRHDDFLDLVDFIFF